MGSELDIKKVLETYKKAVWEQDKDLFLSIYSEHVQVFDAWGRWEYNGLDEWSAMPQTYTQCSQPARPPLTGRCSSRTRWAVTLVRPTA